MNKYDKDDRNLMMAPTPWTAEPLRLVYRLGCYATGLLWVLSWLGLLALFVGTRWRFKPWPFFVIPTVLWLVLIAVPLFWKFHRGTFVTINAVIKTAEAYLQRAGYVVDLNRDGQIGHANPQVRTAVQPVRPLIFRGRKEPVPQLARPDTAQDAVGGSDGLDEVDDGPPRVQMWHLPNGEKIRQEDLCEFVDTIFTSVGWDRATWTRRGMRRELYEGCVALLEEAELLTDRKRGFAGRLTMRNARHARAVLDLPLDAE